MRSMVLNGAGGVIVAACLVAALPVVAGDLADDAWHAGTATLSAEPSNAGLAEGDGGSPACATVAPKDLRDFALANNPRRSESSASVAANPKNPNMLVVALTTCAPYGEDCRCVVYRSHNAGRTWSQPVALPQLEGATAGNDVDLAYTANGERVYAAYTSDETITSDGLVKRSIVVSSSEDNGKTWRRPVIALEGDFYSWAYESPRIATSLDEKESRWIYLTGEQDYSRPGGSFNFTRSGDLGASWSTPIEFGYTSSTGAHGIVRLTVAGGKAGEVLVAGEAPGCTTCSRYIPGGVSARRSHDHGASFDAEVAAATNDDHGSFEGSYGSLDVKVGPRGAAHIAYTRQRWDVNDFGDIAYIWSPGPPYTTWSEPVTVNDDGAGRSQWNPSLTTQKCGASTVLHLVWADARLSPAAYPEYSDVFYARKFAKPGAGWSKNVRVSDKSSLPGAAMSPDLAASQGRVVTVWTDRRDKTDPDDDETDVYASGILSGVTCP